MDLEKGERSMAITNIIFDPKVFNYVIMVLYVLNVFRWAYNQSWGDVWYWISAASITAAITWGYTR